MRQQTATRVTRRGKENPNSEPPSRPTAPLWAFANSLTSGATPGAHGSLSRVRQEPAQAAANSSGTSRRAGYASRVWVLRRDDGCLFIEPVGPTSVMKNFHVFWSRRLTHQYATESRKRRGPTVDSNIAIRLIVLSKLQVMRLGSSLG